MNTPSQSARTSGITGALACATVFALTLGLTYPLLSFQLEALGFDEVDIGISAAMTPLGVLLASPLCPALARRFGAWQVVLASLIAMAVILLLLSQSASYNGFLVLRFGLGIVDALVVVISETWINQLATQKSRGRVIGIYVAALSAGFALGPLILTLTGVEGTLPFVIGIGITLLAGLIVFAARSTLPAAAQESSASSWAFFRLAPTLIVAVGAVAFWDAALLSLYPLYGLGFGHAPGFITLAIAVCAFGNTLLQIPIGWLADRTSSRTTLTACGLIGTVLTVVLATVAATQWQQLVVLFFWGAALGGLYTMSMMELGNRFQGAQLMAGTAAFSIVFGLGGILGGPITGAAMSLFGAQGFPATLFVVFLATLVLAVVRRKRT